MAATPGPPDPGLQGPTAPGRIVPIHVAHGTGEAQVPGRWELSENGVQDLVPEDTSSWLLGALGATGCLDTSSQAGKAGRRPGVPRTCLPRSWNASSLGHFPFINYLAWYCHITRNMVQESTVGARALGLLSHILHKRAVLWETVLPQSASHPGLGLGEAWSPPLQIVLS